MTLWDEARAGLAGLPGGGLNITWEAVDRHVRDGAGKRIAFHFVAASGAVESLSYADLAERTRRLAGGLRLLGVGPGERVFTLLGRVPATYLTALAALRLGAEVSALFTAFGPEPLKIRLGLGRAHVLITTAALYRRSVAPIRNDLPDLRHVVLIDDAGGQRDVTVPFAHLQSAAPLADPPETRPETPALVHFTSGTTGIPKAALHVHDAVVAHVATARCALGLRPGDVFWCTADPGWVTGISYGLIAPLACGATVLVDSAPFEAPRWLELLARHHVNVWYTAPTALRMLRSAGTGLTVRRPLPELRHIASVGEPLDAATAEYGAAAFGVPVRDTWWQTETGAILIANLPGEDVRPGAMGRPLPDVSAVVVMRQEGPRLITVLDRPDLTGELAIRTPWPSMFCSYLDAEERYRACFADGWYLSGDMVRRDADGWFRFVGRGDDVIKTAGHLVGPFEIEQVLLGHPAVAEVAVIGLPDPVIGETIKALVVPRRGQRGDEALKRELIALARRRLGPAIAPRDLAFTPELPRTTSGKVLRRLVRERELGADGGDLSTPDRDRG